MVNDGKQFYSASHYSGYSEFVVEITVMTVHLARVLQFRARSMRGYGAVVSFVRSMSGYGAAVSFIRSMSGNGAVVSCVR